MYGVNAAAENFCPSHVIFRNNALSHVREHIFSIKGLNLLVQNSVQVDQKLWNK